MNVRSVFFAVCYLTATVASCLGVTGCAGDQSRTAQAYAEYQAAAATEDWLSARKALLRLVAAEDGVAEYWIALGTVQLQLGAHADAYYAFTRADELDQGNPQTLAILAQLALAGSELGIAERHAEKLALVAPNDPAATLTFGYVALRRQDLDQAGKRADQLLASFPLDPSAKLLKARVLLARRKPDDAAQLLDDQLKLKPDDILSLKALVALRKRNGEWSQVSLAAMRVAQLKPTDREYAVIAIEAAFRAKEFERAAALSERLLRPESSPEYVGEVLQVWANHWKSPEAVDKIRHFNRRASPEQALAYATYFNDSGAPREVAALLGHTPRLPISAANASVNALIAVSMASRGQLSPAKKVFDEILQIEPDHIYALRERARLLIKAGVPRAAVKDAQRLVTITPSSVRDRLLLAQAYAGADDQQQVDRILWKAFHDIPANHDLYEALRSHVQRTKGVEAANSVDREFQQQQDTQFAREFF